MRWREVEELPTMPREALDERGALMVAPPFPEFHEPRHDTCDGCRLEADLVPGWLCCDLCHQLVAVSYKILNGRDMSCS